MAGALDGIKVIELGQEIQGPYAALFLADMGADVIKVENRESGDLARQMTVARIAGEELPHGDFQQFFFLLNRGKRSLTLDLKQDEGKEVLRRLLDGADVLLTNFRPGVLDRLGFSYEHLHERFPRLIHATASSWGYRMAARLDYNAALGAVNLFPYAQLQHDVNGNSPGPIGPFVEGRTALTIGIRADYLARWQADVGYTRYAGKGNDLSDRDFISASVKYSF